MRRSCRDADAQAPIDLEMTIEDVASEDSATERASAHDRCRNDNARSRWPSRDRASQLPHAERIKAAGCP